MPRLSVIVPGLVPPSDQWLAAISRQRVDDLEVLVGDDTTAATGDYLVFLRPDDEVVPLGLLSLLAALDASGADIAVGTGGTGPGSVSALSGARTATTPLRLPALIEHEDASATVWRRSFWEGNGLEWPARPAHERGFLARGLLLAGSVDVVPEPVTLAQSGFRTTPPSHALRVDELATGADRLDDLHEVARSMADPALRERWESAVLEPALRLALTNLPETAPELRERLVDRAAQILEEAGPGLEADIRATQRLEYHLARRRLTRQLIAVVKADRIGERALLRTHRRGNMYYADYLFRTDRELAVPTEVYRLEREIGVRARVDDVRWEGDTLHIEGYAHLGVVPVDGPRSGRLRLALVKGGGRNRAVVRLPVERVYRPDVTADVRDQGGCYDWAGFRTSVPASALRDRQGWLRVPKRWLRGPSQWAYGVWRLEATVSGDHVRRSSTVTATRPGGARHPELRQTGGVRLVATTGRGRFAVEVDTLPASVSAAEVSDGDLVLTGEVRRRLTARGPATVLVTRASGSTVLASGEVDLRAEADRHSFTTTLPLAGLRAAAEDEPGGEGRWSLRIILPGEPAGVPLRAAEGLTALRVGAVGEPQVELGSTPHGRVALTCRPARPVVEEACWAGDVVELAGRWPDGDFEIALVSREAARERALSPVVSGGRFTLAFSPGAMTTLAGTLPLTYGSWRLVVRHKDQRDAAHALVADDTVLATLPMRHLVGAKAFELTEDDGGLELAVLQDLLDDERGRVNQHRLQRQDFPRFVAMGLRDEVLFESYESRAYADNARAILEELVRRDTGLRCRWVVADGQTDLPPGIEPVRRASRDYYEALARSRYVVVPNYRPLSSWLETPPDQVVVQTWHGAPFKRIALDNQRGEAMNSGDYFEMLRRETSRWDYLVSPNPTSTPILRRAFAYDGEMLETGYPRTDVFFSPDRDSIASSVRARLGIPEGKKVVLYAPTMRDDHHYGANRYRLDLRLDLAAAREELGEDHVLLVRRHAKVVDTVSAADGEFARDVSLWPDVNELLLATDVLVTDYSSLLFDFANTGRPMLFFTYDLEDYRDRLRGLYFDTARMPGPHLSTSAEVVAAIRDVEDHHAAHASTYREFVEEFCAWDDGGASARLVDRVFAGH